MQQRARYLSVMLATFLFGLAITTSAHANQAPEADAGPDQTAYAGDTVILTATATDTDGDAITEWYWEIKNAPAVNSTILGAQAPTTRIGPLNAGAYVVSVKASDGKTWGTPSTMTITVAPAPGQ